MVVWEDRGVLKPPKPPTVHATDCTCTIAVADAGFLKGGVKEK